MSIDRSLWNQFNFFILICIFVRPDWLLVRAKLASGLTNDLPIGKNYLQAWKLLSRKVIALHFSRMQQEFISHCRTHTIQVTHNPSSWWSEHYRLIAFAFAFFGKNWEKIATTSILIPFAKFTFMYGGKHLRIPASRSLLRSRFFPKKQLRMRLCESLFGLAAIMGTMTIVLCMCHEVYQ